MPTPAWGTGRLYAISMIFNRVTGLDIGPHPTHLIPDNIRRADAPARYPFLWNAGKQDKTQWPGSADNGNNALESRSPRGIWAAAPTLHNGSVATFAQLLKPAGQRMTA